jgi:hypothetical protein
VFYMGVKLGLSRYDKCAVWSENVRRPGVEGDIWEEEEGTDRRLEKMESRGTASVVLLTECCSGDQIRKD